LKPLFHIANKSSYPGYNDCREFYLKTHKRTHIVLGIGWGLLTILIIGTYIIDVLG